MSITAFTPERALAIATRAHAGQVRKDGTPYIIHPLSVAIEFSDPELRTIAILHDVVEDTEVTFTEIHLAGASGRVLDALTALTHLHGESRSNYIDRIIASGRDAILVKLSDIAHNMSTVHTLDPKTRERLEAKYIPEERRLFKALRRISLL